MAEATLSSSDYLCAGRFTAADISVGYALLLSHYNGLSEKLPDAVRAYWTRLQAREGFQRADAAQKKAAKAAGIGADI
jgi:glutathione S-transferase